MPLEGLYFVWFLSTYAFSEIVCYEGDMIWCCFWPDVRVCDLHGVLGKCEQTCQNEEFVQGRRTFVVRGRPQGNSFAQPRTKL